ncbi:hypothetical protein BKH41_03645 [Helicobacter sp. 12S02232-10]|uniref:hypothetical protein n=1 Tax=Helicobacter sp. 12S02232-10 TaxID=1476197 RepID=UPI000BA5DD06|nr:hypothetical protein [Helicobacter sp. 12S02232-10]PAF49186.1 hypothetical protein BKH41_03645 [Helicobacter sp. 12S02232-10]
MTKFFETNYRELWKNMDINKKSEVRLLREKRKEALEQNTLLEMILFSIGINKEHIPLRAFYSTNFKKDEDDLKKYVKKTIEDYLLTTKIKTGEFIAIVNLNDDDFYGFCFKYKNQSIKKFYQIEK